MAMLLSLNGYDVTVAEDGRSALRQAAAIHPDIILLDVGLPDISGHEVAKIIRSQEDEDQPLIIALTGWERQDMHPSESCGGCDEFDLFLTKPVNYDDLEKALSEKPRADEQAAQP